MTIQTTLPADDDSSYRGQGPQNQRLTIEAAAIAHALDDLSDAAARTPAHGANPATIAAVTLMRAARLALQGEERRASRLAVYAIEQMGDGRE